MPTAISASVDPGAGQQQRANEHPEGRAELGFVPGKDCVRAEQAERKDDEQGRSDDIFQPAPPAIAHHRVRLMVEKRNDVVDLSLP